MMKCVQFKLWREKIEVLSRFAFNFNLRRYSKEDDFNTFKANDFVGTYTHIEGTLCQQGMCCLPTQGESWCLFIHAEASPSPGDRAKAWCLLIHAEVSLSLSLFELCFVYVIDFTLFFGLRVFIEICVIITRAGTIECKQRAGLDPDIRYVFAIFNRDTVGRYKLKASIPRFLS